VFSSKESARDGPRPLPVPVLTCERDWLSLGRDGKHGDVLKRAPATAGRGYKRGDTL